MTRTRQLLPLALASALAVSVLVACSEDAEPETSPSPSATTSAPESPTSPTSPTATRSPGPPQRVELAMLPQLAQPGPGPAAAANALSAMTASFRPVRPGREVELQVREGDDWVTADSATQDQDGVVEFTAPYQVDGRVQTYRAVAVGDDKLPEAASRPARTDQVGPPDFSTEFAGSALPVGWSHRLFPHRPESLKVCSRTDETAAVVSGGVVRLSVLDDPALGQCQIPEGTFAYRLNGMISTQGQREFTYGTFAARIKFQPLRGQHGAFWMQVASQAASVGDPADTGAEIDVIEWLGEDAPEGGLTSFVQYDPTEAGKKVGDYVRNPDQYGDDWAGEYHVFSVEWTPTQYIFRIDGKETMRIRQGVSGRPEFLILSLSSSDYELRHLGSEANLPQHMYVDWVRHWPR